MLERTSIALLRALHRLKPRRALDPSGVRSLLLVELTRLGDVVSALRAAEELRSAFPGAELHMMVDSRYASFLQATTLAMNVHGMADTRGFSGLARSVRHARRLRCTISASMSPSVRNALVALGSGSPGVIGYLTGEKSFAPFLKRTPVESFGLDTPDVPVFSNEHIEERGLKVAALAGSRGRGRGKNLELDPSMVEKVRLSLRERHILPEGRFIIFHPFAIWEYRRWPIDRYLALAVRMSAEHEVDVVIIGLPAELEGCGPRIADLRQQGVRITSFASHDLLETAVLLSSASLCVGNDSGPLHIAARLGVPVVGLFGPAPPSLTAPRDASGEFLYHPVECSPCDQQRCVRQDAPCIEAITEEEVFAAAARVLIGSSPQSAVANA